MKSIQEMSMDVYAMLDRQWESRGPRMEFARLTSCRRAKHPSYKSPTILRKGKHGLLEVQYFQTVVVTIEPNGIFTLNSGGWQTVTTLDKFNRYSPANVYQKNHVWYVEWVGKTYIFQDRMKFYMNGEVCLFNGETATPYVKPTRRRRIA